MPDWILFPRITQAEYVEIIKIILSESYDNSLLSSKAKHPIFNILRENNFVTELLLKVLESAAMYRQSKPNNKTYTYNILSNWLSQYETLIFLMGLQNEEILKINKRLLWLE